MPSGTVRMLGKASGKRGPTGSWRGGILYLAVNIEAYLATDIAAKRWDGNAGAANGHDSGG